MNEKCENQNTLWRMKTAGAWSGEFSASWQKKTSTILAQLRLNLTA